MSTRTCETGEFKTWDGAALFCRTWAPTGPSDKAVILIHRGHEHSGRLQELLDALDLPAFWAFSWDNRGHGKSPGERGHAPSYSALVRDLDAFVRHVCATHSISIENVAIVANSVGAVTAAAWVHDYALRIRAMVLAAPAFRIKLYIPFAIPMLRMLMRVKPKAVISSYVKSKMLTHDPAQARAYDEDSLITRDISVKILLGLHDASTRIMADAGAIETPTLVLSGGADWVVQNSAHRRFYRGLSSRIKRLEYYPGFFHAILFEADRAKPIAEARRFVLERFKRPVDRSALIEADQGGYTRTEYDELRQPPGLLKDLCFRMQTWLMRTLGRRLSEGIRIGAETGFDSGRSLDYVYDNEARGVSFLGRMIDRGYLDAVGWRGIRDRRTHLREFLDQASTRIAAGGNVVQILDVATGCGRYVLDVLSEPRHREVHACLRDFEPRNLEQGRALADKLGLAHVVFEQGDAFDKDALLAVTPRPNIVIVSGLYELFADNRMLLRSLEGIAGVLQDGGYLVYTCQPWHPQVELIARTLTNRDGNPWIMRRRTQAEMDELVRAVGLTKQDMRIDEYGIFTVSVARKQASG
ncbi:MAG: bifunctional alpha/beta hydrolase/class I SAM-dependent methyltransferase [Verrucomicrobia bacterium]|nr:bifunctional alpha/beta hydrolase/class I SAM-dependent methyltransferase [Verrucomicrobiota bacterium]